MYRPDHGQFTHDGKTFSHILMDRTLRPHDRFQWLARRLVELDPKSSFRNGRMRLMVADRHIGMGYSDDILPGQICVGVESAGYGAGRCYDGIHMVRYWDPDEERTAERVARVDVLGSRLVWGAMPDQKHVPVPRGKINVIANVIGVYSNDECEALRMFAN